MKSFIFISILIFVQFFIAIESRAITKEVNVVYKFEVELDKYKKIDGKAGKKHKDDNENAIIKRMVNEEEKYNETFNELFVDDNDDEIPIESKLEKRATTGNEYFRSQLTSFEKKVYDNLNAISGKKKN